MSEAMTNKSFPAATLRFVGPMARVVEIGSLWTPGPTTEVTLELKVQVLNDAAWALKVDQLVEVETLAWGVYGKAFRTREVDPYSPGEARAVSQTEEGDN